MPVTPRSIASPFRGIADVFAFADMPAAFAPPSSMRNMRPRDPGSNAGLLTSRAGRVRLFPLTYGGGRAVKCFCPVPQDSGVSGYTAVECQRPEEWTPRPLGAISGMVWIRATDGGLRGSLKDLATADPAHIVLGAFVVAWHPTLPRVFFGTLIATTASIATRSLYMAIHCYDIETGLLVWRTFLRDQDSTAQGGGPDLGRAIVANDLQVSADWVMVPCGPYIYVLDTGTGEYYWRHDLTGWSQEVQAVRQRSQTATEWLTLFDGSEQIVAPLVLPDYQHGRDARAGVFLYRQAPTFPFFPIVQRVAFSSQRAPADPLYENHNGLRLSEKLLRRPRGARTNGFAVSPVDNTFVVGMANRGWGFDPATHTPGDPVAPSTIAKFSADGQIIWEADTQSIMAAYTGAWGTFYNDIPQTEGPAGPEYSVNALAIDSQNRIFAAGKRNQAAADAGHNVFAMTGQGALLWRLRLSGTIYQHCLLIDPNDGNLLAFGARNSDWDNGGDPATAAHGWRIDASTGRVIGTFDLGQAVSAYAAAVSPEGLVAYCTDTI